MGHVAVDGVSVPAAIATSFSDPNKRPFSYTQPVPPSSDSERPVTPHRTVAVSLPKVLPIFGDKSGGSGGSVSSTPINTTATTAAAATVGGGGGGGTLTMDSGGRSTTPIAASSTDQHHGSLNYLDRPTNLQYNTPLPLYSRESAEEEYKQQTGAGPDIPLGTGDKHFDPEKSETLKAIKAGEDDSFGKTFFEKIAQAEAPKVFVDPEPDWTEKARLKAERARSATPSSYATRQTPTPFYNPNYATIHGTSTVSNKKRTPSYGKGYEFGGMDYVDRSRIQKTPTYNNYYYQSRQSVNDDRRSTPGYDMGGIDYSKGNAYVQRTDDMSYHGHGPEQPRLKSKYSALSKSNEMNIQTAPNINSVSADVLVGDTVSNQKISKDENRKQKDPFGTSFGPPGGFKEDHRTVSRQEDSQKSGTYSISARKDLMSQGYKQYQENRYKPKQRSYSAAPMDRYDSSTYGEKEVTVETLLNDTALYPRKRVELPHWYSYSLEKQNRWKNGSDPRLSRSQTTYTYEPSWSRTVREKRNAWEAQAQNLESRLQLPASEKVPVHQPPHWYNKATHTHSIWQTAADRNAARAQSEFADDGRYKKTQQYPIYETSYSTETRRTQEYTTGYKENQNALQQRQQEEHKQEEYKHEQQSWNSKHDTSVGRNPYSGSIAVPTPFEQGSQPFSENLQKWEAKSAPSSHQNYYSSSQFEKEETKSSNYSGRKYQQERTIKEQFVTEPKTTRTYETHRSDTVTHHAPVSTKQVVTVTEGTGSNFNRAAEMAEVLPRGSIANTEASTQGNYTDAEGREVSYVRELVTSVDPHRECSLLKEEERRVVETPYEPGIISRHVTTKYYKKKTVTDTTTTTTTTAPQ